MGKMTFKQWGESQMATDPLWRSAIAEVVRGDVVIGRVALKDGSYWIKVRGSSHAPWTKKATSREIFEYVANIQDATLRQIE